MGFQEVEARNALEACNGTLDRSGEAQPLESLQSQAQQCASRIRLSTAQHLQMWVLYRLSGNLDQAMQLLLSRQP